MSRRVAVLAARAVILAVTLVVWEVAARPSGGVDLIAPPSAIAGALFATVLRDEAIRNAILFTLFEVLSAYALAVAGGLVLGLAIGSTEMARRSFYPIVLLLYAIPQVVMLPLVTLVFGIGPAAKIAFGFSHGIFPVLGQRHRRHAQRQSALRESRDGDGRAARRYHPARHVSPHGDEFLHWTEVGHDDDPARRHPCRALRLDGGCRLLHQTVCRELRSGALVCAHRITGRHGDRAQRARAQRRAPVHAVEDRGDVMNIVGVDIGGTFTDLVGCIEGRIVTSKSSTVPSDPTQGIAETLQLAHIDIPRVSEVLHGTTVAINTVLERKGATTALITTRGFRDVYAIGRGNRIEAFNLFFHRPKPLVARALTFEVEERVDADGPRAAVASRHRGGDPGSGPA
jgi:hypothetical protein